MKKTAILIFSFLLFGLTGLLPSSDVSAHADPSTDQNAYQFFNDDGNESGSTTRAAINTAITGVTLTEIVRLRFEVEEINASNVTVLGRIEFSSDATSCTTGTWTAMDTSTTAWRITDSTQFTNATATTDRISGSGLTFDSGFIFDTQNEDATGQVLNSEHTEWEWAFRGDGAANNTTYRFRVTGHATSGTVLTTYTNCGQLTTAGATTSFTFNSYRWYVDPTSPESEDVTDPWGNPDINQDTAISPLPVSNDPPNTTQELRLRVNFTVNGDGLVFGEKAFKLQFKADAAACTDATGWTDVGAAQAWEFATSGVTDGTDLSVSRLSPVSNVLEEYIKSNPTGTNPFSANIGDEIEYDFHIVGTNSATATRYRFRVIESGGTVFDAYTNCPTLNTEPGVGDLLRHGNFFSGGSEQGFFWAN